jgi:hypothetical protein
VAASGDLNAFLVIRKAKTYLCRAVVIAASEETRFC